MYNYSPLSRGRLDFWGVPASSPPTTARLAQQMVQPTAGPSKQETDWHLQNHHPQPCQNRHESQDTPQRGRQALSSGVLAKVPKHRLHAGSGRGDVGVGAGFAGDDGVDVGKADVVAVEAVGGVDFGDAGVVWFDEGYVDALVGGVSGRLF